MKPTITLKELEILEYQIDHLNEKVGLKKETYDDIMQAINMAKKKVK